jgi:hypothetical protein
LVLSPETNTQSVLRKVSIQGSDDASFTVQISVDVKDVTYILILNTPTHYFRDPMGYSFNIRNSIVQIPSSYSLEFNLEIRSAQITNGINSDAPPTNIAPPIINEKIVNFSIPPNKRSAIDSTGYHYVGPYSVLSNEGIWGRFTVVDPDVDHDADWEHVVKRAMASNTYGTTWMEIGWVEKSDIADTRYMYQWDSIDGNWNNIYSLPTGNSLEVAVVHIENSTQWYAGYKSGGYWYSLDTEDLGITSIGRCDLEGEISTSSEHHPDLPECYNDLAYINLGGSWTQWNWQRWATTGIANDSPYDCHYSTIYYDFYIHTH